MLQIGELSDRTGVPARTIRYYERIGLLAPASQSENRYRLYEAKDAERLRFIRSARAPDFSLQEIAQILAARDRNEPPCSHVMTLIQSHINEIETRIRELEQVKRDLTTLYTAGQGLPDDIHMRSCVCHLIRISGNQKGSSDDGG
jgi:DNA-binding transcriptional MerR regulator